MYGQNPKQQFGKETESQSSEIGAHRARKGNLSIPLCHSAGDSLVSVLVHGGAHPSRILLMETGIAS